MSSLPDPGDLVPPPLGEAVAAAAVVAHATTHGSHGGPIHAHCENCGTTLAGPYCHRCGQHDFDVNRSFGHTFLEVLESFFHFDSKFFHGVAVLFFRPGRLTAAFNAGHRAAQMPPFRLYVFVSILFFFLTFLNQGEIGIKPTPADEVAEHAVTINSPADLATALTAAGESPEDIAEAQHAIGELRRMADATGQPSSELNQKIAERVSHLNDPEDRRHLVQAFLHAIPKLVLVCLPLFALYTRFLFRKSGQVYLQHLVLALHFHTFFFLWILVLQGWSFLLGLAGLGLEAWIELAAVWWLLVYPFMMLRHLFANSWPRTIFKTGLLGVAYTATLTLIFVTALGFLLFYG